MSLILDSAREEYVSTNTQPTTTKPITISVWVKSVDNTNYQACVTLCNAVDEFLLLQLSGAVVGDPVRALEYATAWKYAESSSGYSVNTWHHIAATFVDATERNVWIDGGSKVTNTDNQNVNFNLLDRIFVGTHKVIDGAYFDGQIAEIALWKKELSDGQILSLANGTLASNIEPDDLKAYWKLDDNYNDSSGLTNVLVVGNGTPSFSSDHPPVNFPGKPTIVSPTPTGVTGITLDETPLEWAAGDPAGDTYEVYFRESGDDWELVGVAQAGIEWAIEFGTLAYETTYEWRVDATNEYGTTEGTTWSFTTIDFDQIRISYRLLAGGDGVGHGPYDDPPGTEGTDWSWTGENNMLIVRRLVVVVEDKIWYEDL